MDEYDGYVRIGTKIDDSDIKSQLQKTKTNITSTLKTVGIGVGVAAAAIAGFVKVTKELTDAYNVQAKAERALEQAARNNPLLSDKSVKNLKQYASELQKLTNYGDETTIQLMAQLAAAGRTQEEIQKIIKASADLAASGTTTFDGAVRNLNKTFSGLTGELGEVIPDLKTLTAEQLKNGEAIDLIQKKYDGMAASVVDQTIQAKNATGDLAEALGGALNPAVNLSASLWAKVAGALADVINKQNSLRDAVKAYDEGNAGIEQKIYLLEQEAAALKEMRIQGQVSEREKEIQESLNRYKKVIEAQERHNKLLAEGKEKEAALAAEEAKKITEQQKTIDARIEAQKQYESAVNLATEKHIGGLITQEEKWELIKSAAESYTDALINLGYTYEETATIGGKALDDMRRKLVGEDLSKGLGFTSVIGGEGFLNPLTKIAEQWKFTIPKISGLMEDGAEESVSSFNRALSDNENSSMIAIKDFTKNVAGAFSAGLAIAKNVVTGFTTAIRKIIDVTSKAISASFKIIKDIATFDPSSVVKEITDTLTGLTEFFTVTLPLLPAYFIAGGKVINEFVQGMLSGIKKTKEIISNVVTEIFKLLSESVNSNEKGALDVAVEIINTLVSALYNNIVNIKETVRGIITKIFTALRSIVSESGIPAASVAAAIVTSIITSFSTELSKSKKTIIDFVKGVFTVIETTAGENISGALSIAKTIVLAIINSLPQAIKSTASIALVLMKEIAAIMPDVIKGVITSISGNIGSMISEIFALAIDSLINSLEFAPALISAIVTSIPALITGIISSMPTLVAKLIEAIPLILVDLFVFAAELFAQFLIFPAYIWVGIIGGVLSIVEQIIEQVGLFFEDPKAWIEAQKQIGKGIGDAIINSLESVIDRIGETVSTLIDAIVNPFKGIGYAIEKMIGLDINGDGAIGEPVTTGETYVPTSTPPDTTLPTTTSPEGTQQTEKRKLTATIKKINIFTRMPTLIEANGKEYDREEFAKYIFSLPISDKDKVGFVQKLQGLPVNTSVTMEYAKGTSYAEGGLSKINEPYSELVDLPTGSKVMTANATSGLVEQAVQSFIRSTGGLAGMQSERPIILHNYMDGVMNVNGKLLGKIAFENIDRNVRMQYGN